MHPPCRIPRRAEVIAVRRIALWGKSSGIKGPFVDIERDQCFPRANLLVL
jgi:hypothetical protein